MLANQCVGHPATGQEALRLGGIRTVTTSKGLICTMNDHPAACPATFTGQYWTYYHASPGGQWEYSQKGASQYQPAPGSVEAWCYNRPKEYRCTPPTMTVDGSTTTIHGFDAAAELPVTHNQEVVASSSGHGSLAVVAVLIVAVLLVVAILARRRQRGG